MQRLGCNERGRRTSKLLRTIVGVGIALGAAPACFGRTEVASDALPVGATDDEPTFNAWTLHGAPSTNLTHAALVDALRTLVVPGLRELGMRTESIEAWLERGAPTDRPPTE